MKKWFVALAGLLLLIGCSGPGLNVEYLTPQETPFKGNAVFLEINDLRKDQMIVSPAVMQKDLFRDVGDRLTVTVKNPSGKELTLRNTTVGKAFYEAVRMRLESVGLSILPQREPGQNALVIDVEKLGLDLENRTFVAKVVCMAKYYKGDQELKKERISGSRQQIRIVGAKGAEDVVSGAFSSAVNNLDIGVFHE